MTNSDADALMIKLGCATSVEAYERVQDLVAEFGLTQAQYDALCMAVHFVTHCAVTDAIRLDDLRRAGHPEALQLTAQLRDRFGGGEGEVSGSPFDNPTMIH